MFAREADGFSSTFLLMCQTSSSNLSNLSNLRLRSTGKAALTHAEPA